MSEHVRGHTRTLPSGRTVQVRPHDRAGTSSAPVDAPLSEKDQDRRDRFEVRVLREQQQQRKAGRTGRQPARTPGEKRKRQSRRVTKARRHAKKARRLWRRHKARAIGYGLLALAQITSYGIGRGASKARQAVRKVRKRKRGRK